MPKTPIDYRKSVIYKICCNDVSITDVYVGSTTSLSKRKPCHKSACNNERDKAHNLNVYQFIRANGGWDNWDVVMVEEYPCDNKNQLHTRERYQMELLKANLNSIIPTRTMKEWYKENVEHIKEYQKENAEHIKARKKEYYKENAEHIKSQSKERRKENAEHIKAREKEYQKENTEHIKEYQKAYKNEKIACAHCNKMLNRSSMARHIKSKHTE